MIPLAARWVHWGLAVVVLGAIAGCPEPGIDDPNGDSQRGEASLVTDCGNRSVTRAPGPGFVTMSLSVETDVEPADAPLARVLFGSVACWEDSVSSAPLGLYEVGVGGEVLAIISLMELSDGKFYTRTPMPGDQWFEVEDGCLSLGYDAGCVEHDLTHIPYGPCGLGWPVITRQGQTLGDTADEYICVTGTVSYCSDCRFEDGAWHSEVTTSGSYVALGSLDDVFAAGACGQPQEYVDITAGDRVRFSLTYRITYRMSASPEELGYEELELPTWP